MPSDPATLDLESIAIRDAEHIDMAEVQEIYAAHVIHGLASFEEQPPTIEEMVIRRQEIAESGLPWLVAETEGHIIGYAYAGSYRTRRAYRFTVEESVYVAEGLARRGVGTSLLKTLIERCETGPWRQMVAIIGNSGNAGSINLHERLGFRHVGVLRSVGFKHGRWADTVIMQRPLGVGDTTLPMPFERFV